MIYKHKNYRIPWLILLYTLFHKVYSLSECSESSGKCTITKGQKLLEKNKYCISGMSIYLGSSESTGDCAIASTITSTDGYYFFKNNEIIKNADSDPDSGFHCTSNSSCNKITENGIYINTLSPKNIVSYVQEGSSKSIAISTNCAFLTKLSSPPHLIKCDLENGCSAVNSFSQNDVYINGLGKGLKNALISCNSQTQCSVITPLENTYYVSTTDEGGLIICSKDGCRSSSFNVLTPNTYYINNGNDQETKQLIFCDSSSTSCKTVEGKENFYVNGANKTTLIQCIKDAETSEITCSVEGSKSDKFYLNAVATDSTKENAFIKCEDNDGCAFYTPEQGYYLNGDASSLDDALILCEESCSVTKSNNNSFYINGARVGLKNGLIYCTLTSCYALNASLDSFYLSGIASGLEDALIYFDKSSAPSIVSGITNSYYLNRASTNSTNALINCNEDSCFATSEINDSYYITKTYENELSNTEVFKTLVYCNFKGKCANVIGENNSYYLNRAASDLKDALIKCEMVEGVINCDAVTSSQIKLGYYLNAGDRASHYPLITCDTNAEKCNALAIETEVTPGYYVNAGDPTSSIIICGEKCDITTNLSVEQVGGYLYRNSVLNFYYDKTLTVANATTSSFDLYFYVKITQNDVFPITPSGKETIFKVSKYSITRLAIDGILSLGSDHKINTNVQLGNTSNVYSCIKSKLTCTRITTCITNAFYLNKISNVGYFCDSNSLIKLTKVGYYIDGSRHNGSNTPYLIYCNGDAKCVSVDEPFQYYLNAGINYLPQSLSNFSPNAKNEKVLIYCNGMNCNSLIPSTGYYVAGLSSVDVIENRLIYCSNGVCNEPRPISNKAYFINSGVDNTIKPIISCDTNVCSTKSVNPGYFITEKEDYLIQCESSTCKEIKPSAGYFFYGDYQSKSKLLIECVSHPATGMECNLIQGEAGYYVSTTKNVLINCAHEECKLTLSKNGIFRSATTSKVSSKRSLSHLSTRANTYIYNLIICNKDECHELSSLEMALIPICSFLDDKCYIESPSTSDSSTEITTIPAGNYCTNSDRSQIYFATSSISIKKNEVESSFSTPSSTKNCLEVSKKYSENFYVYQNIIYKLNDYSITQISNPGYYFINVATNTLASPTDISTYNDENTKLFKCDDEQCELINRPEKTAYFADANKKIIKYDEDNDCYSFIKDIICIYSNTNKCIPNSNMNGQNVCITYKGELVITSSEIQSHESGTCYKSKDIHTNIYGYSRNLYTMNVYSAQLIQNTSYIFINNISHTNASYKDIVNGKTNYISIYGCLMSNCKLFEPQDSLYYYNSISNYLIKYENGLWITPKTSGYALVTTNPNEIHIYKFSVVSDKVILENRVSEGFYYTVDEEMYTCGDKINTCEKISESGYYFTRSDEMYYCLYDSEHIEKTTCYKQTCTPGQYYFIEDRYHRCEKGSIMHPVAPKYCSRFDKVVINFPVMYKENLPNRIRKAIDNVELHNNSTAVIKSTNINNMNIVPGIFTNCKYNSEDEMADFDLICLNNYVEIDKDKDAKICSIENFGFIECEADSQNPEKCHASLALSKFHYVHWTFTIIIAFITYLFLN
ncbi:scaffoldin [Neocallimastix sp. 'constans']|jgi:hypothetical protein